MRMVRIPSGVLTMGSQEYYWEEGPVHQRRIGSFSIDEHPVTNDEFARFVADSGYVTTAEKPLDPDRFPGADPSTLVPGALVFTPTKTPVDLSDWRQWWRWQPGANWRAPYGPGSSIDGISDHPVVQVSYEDAQAYAHWARKRLPTEAEWEWAARGGLVGKRYAWGDEFEPDGRVMANTWRGRFPYLRESRDGAENTTPVTAYPVNGYGLFDMIGNVWEWTSDRWTSRHLPPDTVGVERGDRQELLASSSTSVALPRHVLKGGSHLCAPEYCLRYRPAARSPQSVDSATSHLGFRCVV